MPAARTVMSTAFRCTPKAHSRRVPSNKHRKAVAPPITFTAKSTQFSIMARANVLEENRDSASLRMQGQMPRLRVQTPWRSYYSDGARGRDHAPLNCNGIGRQSEKDTPFSHPHARRRAPLARVRCTAGFGVNPECIELAVTRG